MIRGRYTSEPIDITAAMSVQNGRIDEAMQGSWTALLDESQRNGASLVIWRNNRVEHVDPRELLAEADATQSKSSAQP